MQRNITLLLIFFGSLFYAYHQGYIQSIFYVV